MRKKVYAFLQRNAKVVGAVVITVLILASMKLTKFELEYEAKAGRLHIRAE